MSSDTSPQDVAKNIRAKFSEEYSEYPVEEMTPRVELFMNTKLPQDELERAIVKLVAEDLDITKNELLGKPESGGAGGNGELSTITLSDIESVHTNEGTLVNIDEIVVTTLWEPRSEKIAQVGLVADPTAETKFVSFTTSELETLEEGKAYKLESVWTDEYQGNYSIKLASNTTITELDETVEVGGGFTGVLVNVQQGSGLIERCTEEDCTRVLKNGRCSEHGDVEGEEDLRLKAWVDNGSVVKNVIIGPELTAELTGINLDDAMELAMEALDKGVVAEEMSDRVVGRYYHFGGSDRGRYFIANEVTVLDEFDAEEFDLADLSARAEEVAA
jgi:replication factor A1